MFYLLVRPSRSVSRTELLMKISSMTLPALVLTLVSVAAGCASTPAATTAPASPIVVQQLDSAVSMMRGEGFVLAEQYRLGSLDDGGESVQTVNLTGGSTYFISGVCDAGCDDLDLELEDSTGERLDADYEMDDVPMLMMEIPRTGTYVLRVGMVSCTTEPCGWGVAIFVER